jgi:hypothetical protein
MGVVIGFGTFLVFAAFSALHGGGVPTARSSPISAVGPYLLDNRGHFTEVDRQTYVLIVWLSRAYIPALALGGICLEALRRGRRK